MQKLGNGKNIEEDLENYMYRVDRVEKQNGEINSIIKGLDKDLEKCIQKIGIVRYNAFKDVGSDLSLLLLCLTRIMMALCLMVFIRERCQIFTLSLWRMENQVILFSEEEQEAIKKLLILMRSKN